MRINGTPQIWSIFYDVAKLVKKVFGFLNAFNMSCKLLRSSVLLCLLMATNGMSDEVSSWHLSGDGQWTRHTRDAEGNDLLDHQLGLIETNAKRRQQAAKARRR